MAAWAWAGAASTTRVMGAVFVQQFWSHFNLEPLALIKFLGQGRFA